MLKYESFQAVEEGEDVHLELVSQSFYAVSVSRPKLKKNLIYPTHVVQQTVKTHTQVHMNSLNVCLPFTDLHGACMHLSSSCNSGEWAKVFLVLCVRVNDLKRELGGNH